MRQKDLSQRQHRVTFTIFGLSARFPLLGNAVLPGSRSVMFSGNIFYHTHCTKHKPQLPLKKIFFQQTNAKSTFSPYIL